MRLSRLAASRMSRIFGRQVMVMTLASLHAAWAANNTSVALGAHGFPAPSVQLPKFSGQCRASTCIDADAGAHAFSLITVLSMLRWS